MKLTNLFLLLSLATSACSEESGQPLIKDDLSNWTFITKEGDTPPSTAWKIENGVLSTTGKPIGYLRTKETYKNYTLSYEWRWMPDTEKNNSGLLVHISTPGQVGVWPKCLEPQLMQGGAGDIFALGETLEATGENKGIRWARIADPKEKTLGEWNTMTVECKDNTITIHVNGVLVNKGKNLSTNKGAIGFQAEGSTIEFRNAILKTEE